MFCLLTGIFLCFAGASSPVNAATYYLDAVNGNDSNPIPISWATAKKTFNSMSDFLDTLEDDGAGDIVDVNTGNYGDISGGILIKSRIDWLTFRAASGKIPTCTAISIDTYPNYRDVYLKFDGWQINEISKAQSSKISIRNANYITFTNVTVNTLGFEADWYSSRGINLNDADHITIDHCTIDGNGSEYFGGVYYGIYSTSAGANYVTITNCDVSETNIGIHQVGSHWTILHNKYS